MDERDREREREEGISVPEAARRLGVGENTVRRWFAAYQADPKRKGQPGVLKGWYGKRRAFMGQERRIDPDDVDRINREGSRPVSPAPDDAQ